MKVMLVNGSPHENGCTYTALCEAQKVFAANGIETEIFWVGNKPISGCIGCGTCRKIGKCCIDDTVNEFVEKAKICDGFVFGTPVYYAHPSGRILSFLDRAFYSAHLCITRRQAALLPHLWTGRSIQAARQCAVNPQRLWFRADVAARLPRSTNSTSISR